MNLYKEFLALGEKDNVLYYKDKNRFNPIKDPNKSWNFIERYFELSSKNSVLPDKKKELKEKGKNKHTVSMYFLGVLTEKLFSNKINQFLDHIRPKEHNYNYKLVWFLSCLFHDMYWIEEKNNKTLKKYNNCDNKKYFKDLIYNNKISCENLLFNHKLKSKSNYKNNKNFKNFKTTYSKETVENYFKFRFKEHNCIDHGINAGVVFFDQLKKNYKNKYNKYNKNKYNNDNYFELDENNGLGQKIWRKNHIDLYAYVSDSIVSHNIWFSNNNKKLYKKYELDELIRDQKDRISLDKNPLLFRLGILDTIEPVKFFNEFNFEYVLKNIDIVINIKKNYLKLKINDSAIFNYYNWFNKIKSLENWLKVKINIESKKIKIKFL
jgi:hypothetical protein